MPVMEDGITMQPLTPAQVRAIGANPDVLPIAAPVMLAGFTTFSRQLEGHFFKPGTPANDLFQLHLIQGEEHSLPFPFWVITIPRSDRDKAQWAAARAALIVEEGTIPLALQSIGVTSFPMVNAVFLVNQIHTIPNRAVAAAVVSAAEHLRRGGKL
jgi:hypothetical protein